MYVYIRSYSRVAPHSPQTARLFISLSLYSILTLIPALSLSEGEGAGCASVTSRCIRSIRFTPNLLGDKVLHKAGESRACVPTLAHDPRGGAVHKGIPAVIPLNRECLI